MVDGYRFIVSVQLYSFESSDLLYGYLRTNM